MNFLEKALLILAELAAGKLSNNEAQQKIAALDAADAAVDELEEKKING